MIEDKIRAILLGKCEAFELHHNTKIDNIGKRPPFKTYVHRVSNRGHSVVDKCWLASS